ncbi:hypothetical protein FT663_03914 [Candidozyma haemuli var. vulneris]|uniref:Uncharacterized protein n=1 Tax=Candidozyma haemuli TaxID=45357 RepID=A0A2V1AYN4_9ASCO|nr:hypothetical protein CXQ85_002929 [[Candida] haemuloni]KAF3987461.1 hypothetical protein FT662_03981 [[Candida] haemuloni var. vulneris]KAF3988746.1 hypothetical protein FT663_03914 [[Candida] haemuloni var. vulneris]PVH23200.1 hypothetical protein CXQ85_002929 [[Candida] haemuloni]
MAELADALAKLAENEQAMGDAEKDVEVFRIKRMQSIYESRAAITKTIPQFWYIVLAQNDDFGEYIRPEDLKYLESITDIYVDHPIADTEHHRDFTITFSFGPDGNVPQQDIVKKFTTVDEDGEAKLYSESVEVQWPEELKDISPALIRKNKQGKNYSSDEKKKYRQGMKSLFAWFEWTGKKPSKEFRSGEDLARLIVDDLVPNAVHYYSEAINNDAESEVEDSSEGEELDLSEDEPEKKKQKTEE